MGNSYKFKKVKNHKNGKFLKVIKKENFPELKSSNIYQLEMEKFKVTQQCEISEDQESRKWPEMNQENRVFIYK